MFPRVLCFGIALQKYFKKNELQKANNVFVLRNKDMLANILGPLKTTVRHLIILTWKSSSLGPTDERAH